MFEVSVTGRFLAAHHLRLAGGVVEPPHAHKWRVTAAYRGPQLDENGLLVDFATIQAQLAAIVGALYDADLNALPAFAERPPSAESVAAYIAEQLAATAANGAVLSCVEVEEAPGCVARWRPE